MGDYATPAPRGLLFRSRGERHPTELASLHGRRFVTCSEIEDGQAFDEALTKDLTGGDPIECRRMREDFWLYWPTHKLWIAGNHKPFVMGDDEGIWRRMRLVPWTVMIPEGERDPELGAKLRAELPGILNRAIKGCLEWRSSGLESPAAVVAATRAYRTESDALGEFLRVYCAFQPGERVARKALRLVYETWCQESGSEPLGARRFAARLRERGVTDACVRTQDGPRDGWEGVRFSTDAERVAALSWGTQAAPQTNGKHHPVEAPADAPETLADWLATQA
jgi:putative DNA primase/helicase